MLSGASERLSAPRMIRDRTSGAVLALVVQAGFLLMFLLSSQHLAPLRGPTRETILLLHPLPQTAPRTIDARGAFVRKTRPIEVPIVPNITSPLLAPPSGLAGFGHSLFGCAPENFTNLDEAQRSRCRKLGALPAFDPGAVDYADHTDRVPGVKRWERELARKNAPLLLPCGNSRSADPVYTGACIIANIANGFTFKKQYENQPAYSDDSGK
jgi:hypothetical protein